MSNFSVSVWLMENLISGVKRGVFAQEFAALSATDYFMKGILSAEQVQRIALEAIYIPPEIPAPVPEVPIEEPSEEPSEEPLQP